jgi:hypothetical protein
MKNLCYFSSLLIVSLVTGCQVIDQGLSNIPGTPQNTAMKQNRMYYERKLYQQKNDAMMRQYCTPTIFSDDLKRQWGCNK